MTTPAILRLGIVGIGNMGSAHLHAVLDGKIKRCEIAAICDQDKAKLARFPKLKTFEDSKKMIRSGAIDALLIATPHFDHTTIGIDALEQGLHVMVEKPLSVHKADCEKLIAAYKKRPKKSQVFAAMFNQRTNPNYQKLRQMIKDGELGAIKRVNWIITDWYRTQAYYNSGGWRATYRGEGGGVLTNQCPHQLDLMQWLFGMPAKVRGHIGIGKWHDIEVEDAVTAYLEYPNGATGVFITTTGEAPGTNRLEVTGDRGKVVVENGHTTFWRTTVGVAEHCATSSGLFAPPEVWECKLPASGTGGQHNEVLNNFVDAILDGKELLAPAVEGIHSVELGNAMVLSSILDKTLALPLAGALVEKEYRKLIAKSKWKKPVAAGKGAGDFAASFGK